MKQMMSPFGVSYFLSFSMLICIDTQLRFVFLKMWDYILYHLQFASFTSFFLWCIVAILVDHNSLIEF